MGVEFVLVNETKKEKITFAHLNGCKKKELAGNAPQAAIVTWYLLNNQGDQIQFVSDTYNDWPFQSEGVEALSSYIDMTNALVDALIESGILADRGVSYIDENDKDSSYIRNIINIWDS